MAYTSNITDYSPSFFNVMMLINSMNISLKDREDVGRRLVSEATGKNLSRVYSRLDYLGTLKENWDGENALPVSKKVISNLKNVLLLSDDNDWENWLIGPDTNATLGLQSKKTHACISIGNDEYSFYTENNGKELSDSHINFTPESFLSLMRQIG
jgi:hypothetical protein